MLRFCLFISVLLVFCQCENEEEKVDDLLLGKWMIHSIDKDPVETRIGYEFAPNKQYFTIDSQGKPIPKLMERVWSIDEDTLKMVDFNWEPDFIDKKGTLHFLILEIDSEKMELERTKGGGKPGEILLYKKY